MVNTREICIGAVSNFSIMINESISKALWQNMRCWGEHLKPTRHCRNDAHVRFTHFSPALMGLWKRSPNRNQYSIKSLVLRVQPALCIFLCFIIYTSCPSLVVSNYGSTFQCVLFSFLFFCHLYPFVYSAICTYGCLCNTWYCMRAHARMRPWPRTGVFSHSKWG